MEAHRSTTAPAASERPLSAASSTTSNPFAPSFTCPANASRRYPKESPQDPRISRPNDDFERMNAPERRLWPPA
jgi:hypothetical protein